jgi:outer membrane protein OmpA-like peptidoglycan-associated protein
MKTSLLLILSFFIFQNINAQFTTSDNETHILVPPIYNNVKDFSEGLAAVKVDSKWGFIDKLGKSVIKPKYKESGSFSEGLAAVKLSDDWGFINAKGEIIIQFRYKEVRAFQDGVSAVNKDGFWGAIDKNGKEVIPFEYDNVESFSEGLALVEKGEYVKDGGKIYKEGVKYSFVDKTGSPAMRMYEREVLSFSEGLAPIKEDNKWGYIDRIKKVGGIAVQFDSVRGFNEHYAAVQIKGRWGFVNKNGKTVIQTVYQTVGDFSEGLVSAKLRGKWGFLDQTENIKIEFKYDSLAGFSNQLALVNLNDKFGFINRTNEVIIPIDFENARSFSNGAAAFKKNGKWGFITLNSMKPQIIKGKLVSEINGQQEPLANATVKLSNQNDSTTTDKNGIFILNMMNFDSSILLQVNTKSGVKKVELLDASNEHIAELDEKNTNTFEYRILKEDIPSLIVPEEEEVTMVFKGKLLTTNKGLKIPLQNAKVKFSHSDESTTTDVNGEFTLKTENYLQEATLEVETNDKISDVILASSTGKEISSMEMISNGKFQYKILKSEYPKMLVPEIEEVTPTFRGKLLTEKNDKKIPIPNATVQLSGSSETAITDKYGDFEIKSNGIYEGALLKVETDIKITNVIVATQGGEEIGIMTSVEGKQFEYKLLKSDIKTLLITEVEEDVEMIFKNANKSQNLKISQPIHYAFGKYELEASSYATLDKIVKILADNPKIKLEITSHTDAAGAASYNLLLSKKRAETVKTYLINNKINKKRLTAKGMGETEIRNRCLDNVNCSEKEHEYNRRTEFKFIME